jgi:small subunit ribosomal protein S20
MKKRRFDGTDGVTEKLPELSGNSTRGSLEFPIHTVSPRIGLQFGTSDENLQPVMPNTSSAKKALRQNKKRRLANRAERSSLRTTVKKCRDAAASGEATVAADAFRDATKQLDQAAAKHLIHKNAAARTKSRLSRLLRIQAGG